MPGPGQYDVDTALKKLDAGSTGSGKFNMSNSKTFLDLAVYNAKGKPSPAEYHLPDATAKIGGGKFNMSRPKTDVDWQILKASKMPAPGQYGAGQEMHPTGGKFNTGNTRSDIDWAILRASRTPGPGQYNVTDDDSYKRLQGGKFSNNNAKSDVEWQIYRAAQQPGPGNYDLSRSDRYLAKGSSVSFASRPGPCNMPAPFADSSFRSSPTSPAHSRAVSPDASMWSRRSSRCEWNDPEATVRAGVKAARHTERMKTAVAVGAVKRRQRSTMGFGRSFFM